MFHIDLHVHTQASPDGSFSITQFDRMALKKRLKGFAVTDHNTTKSLKYIKDCKSLVIPGIEVSCYEGHVLVLGVTSEFSRMGVTELVEKVSDLSGIVVAAHPYRAVTGIGEEVVVSNDFNAIETVNSRTWEAKNRKAKELAQRLRLPCTGGSDAHTLDELGLGYTKVDGENVDDVLENIRKGMCSAGGHGKTVTQSFIGAVRNTIGWLKRRSRI